jgi:hypothetical protein
LDWSQLHLYIDSFFLFDYKGGHWRIALSMCTMSVGASVFIFLKSLDEKKYKQQQQRFALQNRLVHESE